MLRVFKGKFDLSPAWLSHTVACSKASEVNWSLGTYSSGAASIKYMHMQCSLSERDISILSRIHGHQIFSVIIMVLSIIIKFTHACSLLLQ